MAQEDFPAIRRENDNDAGTANASRGWQGPWSKSSEFAIAKNINNISSNNEDCMARLERQLREES